MKELSPQDGIPFDYAKRKYLKSHISGWQKMHDLLLRQGDEVFLSTINHIKKHTMYQNSLLPQDHKIVVDAESSKKDVIQKVR